MARRTGILTFHRGPNYGGYLQAWHLREAVRGLGHDCEVINYQNRVHEEFERIRLRGGHPREFVRYLRLRGKETGFPAAVADLAPGPVVTGADAVNWSTYDKIIVGSDIVWDYTNPNLGSDPVYFGAHPGQRECAMLSYAASCGESPGGAEVPAWVQHGLARFQQLGVRDEATCQLVQDYGSVEPVMVVDPTWLQDDPHHDWNQLPGKPYVLVYGGALNRERGESLRDYCRSNGLTLVGASSGWGMVDRMYNGITPWQWVELYRNATAVVTATLHGLLYAIKFRKPFLMVRLGPASAKSKTVIERTNCQDRIVGPESSFDMPALERALGEAFSSGPDIQDWIDGSRGFLASALSAGARSGTADY